MDTNWVNMNHSLQLGGLEENQHREMTRCEYKNI